MIYDDLQMRLILLIDQASLPIYPSSPCKMSLPRIETANALSLPQFRSQYLPTISLTTETIALLDLPNGQYDITLESPASMDPSDLTQCYDLVAFTSSAAYATSGVGWVPRKKRKEMELLDLRYLLVKKALPAGASMAMDVPVEGFLSFMLTYEDGFEVVYCYEVHVQLHLRGLGVGTRLMDKMEEVGRKVGVEKAMLTVFRENKAALNLYQRLGYSEDDFSPRPRELRNGVMKSPTYVILSKNLKRSSSEARVLVP